VALRLDGKFINRSETPGVRSTFVASQDLTIQGLSGTKAALIHNHASLLESLNGSVFLKAKHILNARNVVVGRQPEAKWERDCWWFGQMPPDLVPLSREAYWGEYSWFWLQRPFYDASRSEPEGQILAGQHLVIEGDLVENASSLLSARGDAWINRTLWQHGQKDYTYIAYRWKGGGSRVEYSNYCNLVHDFAPASLLVGGRLRGDVKMKTDAPLPKPFKPARKTIPYGPESQFTENANISFGNHRGFAPQPQTNLQALAKTKLPGFVEQILQKAKEKVASGSVGLNPNFNPQKTFTPTVSLTASAQKTLLNPQVQTQSQPKTADQLIAEAMARAEAKAKTQLQPPASAQQSLAPLGSTPPQAPNAANYVIDLVKSKSRKVKKATHLLLQTQGMQVDPEAFLSSDYAVQRITYFGNDPERVLRVGDGYFEAQLIQDQILKITGFPLLRGYQDPNTMIQTLYDNGFRYLEAQLERRYQQTPNVCALQGPGASKAQALANLRTHHIVRGPDKGDPLPDQDMLILEPVQLMLPQDEDEGRDQLALALTAAREALTSGRPIPKGASAVLELWAPRFYPCQKTLNQWRGGTVAKQIELTLGDEPIRGQTFEADQACFQNPSGNFTMVGGGIRAKETLALIFEEGECNLYSTQLEGGEAASKALLYGGKHLKVEAETLDSHTTFGRTRHLGTSPTLKFQEALAYGGEGGLSIQSAVLKVPHQLTLLSQGEMGIGALASEFHSYSGGGDNWRKDDRITHRLTQAEVGNLVIATPDNLKVTGLEVTADRAKIQLGGGYLAESPQDLYHHSHHMESDDWFSSSSEDVSHTTLSTRRNVLNIKDASLSGSRFVDRGGAYGGHAHATSPRAQVEAVIDKLEHMASSTDSNLFFISGESRGDIRHTPVFTTAQNLTISTTQAHLDTPPGGKMPKGLTLVPFNPAALQAPQVEDLLQAFLEGSTQLSLQAPSHVIPAQAGIQEIPDQELLLEPEVTLHPVQGAYEHWDKSTFGLTPGFGAVLGLAVTLATGGAAGPAAQAATAMGFGTEGAAFLAAKAGVQALAKAATVGVLSHQGNFGKALEDAFRPPTLRSIAASAVTAGLTQGLATHLEIPTTQLTTFGEHAAYAGLKTAVSVPVQATLGGKKLGDALTSGATTFAADTIGGYFSTQIGKAYGAENLNYAEHKMAHAAVGAATGAILDPKNPGSSALSGALGAVTSEMLAEAISGNPKEMATRVLGEVAERAAREGRKFSQKEYETALKEAAEVAKNIGQLGAASVALLSRQNVETAIHTAQTATENNLIPGLIAGGLIIWSAYDLWETYANEGPEAALEQAGVEVVVAVVGGTAIKRGFKIAGKIYPIAEAAWAAHVAENPIMAKIGEVITGAVEKGKIWIGRGMGRASQAPSRNVALEALDLNLTGEYRTVAGHHVHAKKAFEGHVNYDPRKGFSISDELMEKFNIKHEKVTTSQQRLFRELAASGSPNTMREHTRIAVEALMEGGCQSREVARKIVAESLQSLRKTGVTQPTTIPWGSTVKKK
jgi:Possible hemagglutinin (DUF637)